LTEVGLCDVADVVGVESVDVAGSAPVPEIC
jgi:hypothetical protein